MAFWFKKAQIKLVTDQLKAIQSSRIGMAQDKDYERAVSELERQLRELQVGKNEIVKQSWKDLTLQSRRKK